MLDPASATSLRDLFIQRHRLAESFADAMRDELGAVMRITENISQPGWEGWFEEEAARSQEALYAHAILAAQRPLEKSAAKRFSDLMINLPDGWAYRYRDPHGLLAERSHHGTGHNLAQWIAGALPEYINTRIRLIAALSVLQYHHHHGSWPDPREAPDLLPVDIQHWEHERKPVSWTIHASGVQITMPESGVLRKSDHWTLLIAAPEAGR